MKWKKKLYVHVYVYIYMHTKLKSIELYSDEINGGLCKSKKILGKQKKKEKKFHENKGLRA